MPSRRSTTAILAAVALLTLSACGARLSKDQLAAARGAATTPAAQQRAGTRSGTPTGNGTTTGNDAADGGTVTGGDTPGGAAAGSTAGTTPALGDGGGGAAAGGGCTPTAGTAGPGVTDSTITFGNVSTISGPIPGFGQTGVNGVNAYFKYINSQGGVCGRQLKLETGDDRLDAGQNKAAVDAMKDKVLGFVGGTTVVDGGGASSLDGTDIPAAQLAISDTAIKSPNVFSPNPIDPSGTSNGTVGIWQWMAANRGITKVAVVYPQQADAQARAQAYVADIKAAGLQVDGPYVVSVTETNYAGTVQKMQGDGADAFITALEVNGMARLAKAVQQADFKPKVAFYGAQSYGAEFLKLAGDAAEGTTIGIAYDIVEDGANPVTGDFASWYSRTNPGSEPDFFAIMGWAAADMMVQALEAAGGAPTRDAVMGALRTFNAFDAHGLLAPCDPPGKHGATSFLVVTVSGGRWSRVYPASGFAAG